MSDPVNHPMHYRSDSGIECIDVVEHMTFNLGNAVKHIWRSGTKGNQIEDLQKACWYLEREMQRIKEQEIPNQGGSFRGT